MARIAGRANVGLSITGGTGGIDLSASQIDSIPLFPVGSVATQPDAVAVVTAVPASERSERHLAKRVARRAGALAGALARGDAVMLVVAVMLAEFGAARAGIPHTPVPVLVAFVALVLALFGLRGMYRPRADIALLDDIRAILSVTALAAMMLVSARVFFSDDSLAAQQGVRLWAFAAFYLAAGRAVTFHLQRSARRRGVGLSPTLIVGAGHVGELLAERLLARPELGLRPVGFLDKEPLVDRPSGLPVLGASWDLERVVKEHDVEQVIISFSTAPMHVLLGVMERAERLGLKTAFVPRLYERTTARLSVRHIGGLPLVSARRVDPHGWKFAIKYALDRVVAATLLLLVSPLMIVSAAAVYVSMGRPIFFRQRRVGADGREFDMLKFRSMRGTPSADGEADADWFAEQIRKAEAAPMVVVEDRRTRVGTFLRRTSIDELPQLLNVLRGEMSLVGPRPERPAYVRRFQDAIYRYSDRHRVKAGITGWAQVHGLRGKTSVSDRAEWDNYYIENFSLWLDFKILLLTAATVVGGSRHTQ